MSDAERLVRPTPPERRKPVRIPALTSEKVADYVDRIMKTATWLAPADYPLVTQVARNLAIADQVWAYFEQRQFIDSRGRPRGAVRQWLALENTIGRELNALGFAPLARAELQRLVVDARADIALGMRQVRADEALERRGPPGELKAGETPTPETPELDRPADGAGEEQQP